MPGFCIIRFKELTGNSHLIVEVADQVIPEVGKPWDNIDKGTVVGFFPSDSKGGLLLQMIATLDKFDRDDDSPFTEALTEILSGVLKD